MLGSRYSKRFSSTAKLTVPPGKGKGKERARFIEAVSDSVDSADEDSIPVELNKSTGAARNRDTFKVTLHINDDFDLTMVRESVPSGAPVIPSHPEGSTTDATTDRGAESIQIQSDEPMLDAAPEESEGDKQILNEELNPDVTMNEGEESNQVPSGEPMANGVSDRGDDGSQVLLKELVADVAVDEDEGSNQGRSDEPMADAITPASPANQVSAASSGSQVAGARRTLFDYFSSAVKPAKRISHAPSQGNTVGASHSLSQDGNATKGRAEQVERIPGMQSPNSAVAPISTRPGNATLSEEPAQRSSEGTNLITKDRGMVRPVPDTSLFIVDNSGDREHADVASTTSTLPGSTDGVAGNNDTETSSSVTATAGMTILGQRGRGASLRYRIQRDVGPNGEIYEEEEVSPQQVTEEAREIYRTDMNSVGRTLQGMKREPSHGWDWVTVVPPAKKPKY